MVLLAQPLYRQVARVYVWKDISYSTSANDLRCLAGMDGMGYSACLLDNHMNSMYSKTEGILMTLEDLRASTGWSKHELARQSGIDINTLNRALRGDPISINTANRLAIGLSKGLNRTITAKDIEGLNVK